MKSRKSGPRLAYSFCIVAGFSGKSPTGMGMVRALGRPSNGEPLSPATAQFIPEGFREPDEADDQGERTAIQKRRLEGERKQRGENEEP
jgi:hypothetical protein